MVNFFVANSCVRNGDVKWCGVDVDGVTALYDQFLDVSHRFAIQLGHGKLSGRLESWICQRCEMDPSHF